VQCISLELTVAEQITDKVEGMSLYGVLVVFAGLILVVATFISHTVAALIFLPLVQQVGQGMAEPHPNLLVMGSVLMCSAAMGLPTSGFPNMSKFPHSILLFLHYNLDRKTDDTSHHSGHHDGGQSNGPALPAGEAFHYQRCSSISAHIRGRHHCWIWAYAFGAFLSAPSWSRNTYRANPRIFVWMM